MIFNKINPFTYEKLEDGDYDIRIYKSSSEYDTLYRFSKISDKFQEIYRMNEISTDLNYLYKLEDNLDVISTLPERYRPYTNCIFTTNTLAGGIVNIMITTNGNIVNMGLIGERFTPGSNIIDLGNISYIRENAESAIIQSCMSDTIPLNDLVNPNKIPPQKC